MPTTTVPELALLNQDLDQIMNARQGLREKHPGHVMPEEARAEDERLTERAVRVTRLIEERKQIDRDAAFENTARYVDEPVHVIPHALNADDDGKRLLERYNWRISNGLVEAPTSAGKYVPMFGEDVLFGPIPTGPKEQDLAAYFRQTRAAFQPEYRAAYVKWLKDSSRNDGAALSNLSQQERNALSEGADGSGGFLVPPDIQAEILVRLPQTSVMRRLAQVRTTSRDKLLFPNVKPNATAANANIYSSGFVGGWAGETPAFSDTDPAFGMFEIPIKKIRVATKLSNDWLADSVGNMLAFLAQNGAENMALVEDQGFIAGDGTALQPLGILNTTGSRTLVASGGMAIDVEGTTEDTINNSTSDAGSVPKIQNLVYSLPSQYAQNASWLMRRSVEGHVRGLVDGNGRPIWLSYNESGLGVTPRNIDGYPVYNSEFVEQDTGDANNLPLVFGDIGAYIIGQRAQISTVILRERFADTDQTGVILFERAGGALWNTGAVRFGVIPS